MGGPGMALTSRISVVPSSTPGICLLGWRPSLVGHCLVSFGDAERNGAMENVVKPQRKVKPFRQKLRRPEGRSYLRAFTYEEWPKEGLFENTAVNPRSSEI